MTIEQLQLRLALKNAKDQILSLEYRLGNNMANELSPSSLDAIALLDTEIYKVEDAPKKQKLNTWIDGFVMGTPAGLNDDETVVSILEKFEAFKKLAKVQIENL